MASQLPPHSDSRAVGLTAVTARAFFCSGNLGEALLGGVGGVEGCAADTAVSYRNPRRRYQRRLPASLYGRGFISPRPAFSYDKATGPLGPSIGMKSAIFPRHRSPFLDLEPALFIQTSTSKLLLGDNDAAPGFRWGGDFHRLSLVGSLRRPTWQDDPPSGLRKGYGQAPLLARALFFTSQEQPGSSRADDWEVPLQGRRWRAFFPVHLHRRPVSMGARFLCSALPMNPVITVQEPAWAAGPNLRVRLPPHHSKPIPSTGPDTRRGGGHFFESLRGVGGGIFPILSPFVDASLFQIALSPATGSLAPRKRGGCFRRWRGIWTLLKEPRADG